MLAKFDFLLWEIEQKMRRFDNGPCIDHTWAIDPIKYYVNTGRAPTEFLVKLISVNERQKTTIAKRLLKAYRNHGDYNTSINTVCDYIGFQREQMC